MFCDPERLSVKRLFILMTEFYILIFCSWSPSVYLLQNRRKVGSTNAGFSFLDLVKSISIRILNFNIFLTSGGNCDPCSSTFSSSNFIWPSSELGSKNKLVKTSLILSIKSASSWKRKLSNKGRPPQDLRWGPYAVVERKHRPHYMLCRAPLYI